ncbi:MAG: 4-hydroxybenzoate decarboxylase [Acidobacteria bacterium]|nr:MAG: 4-hydroxybenzoate decarboxylase [Acidobacteriota bacterium]
MDYRSAALCLRAGSLPLWAMLLSALMRFDGLQDFIRYLERQGELKRVRAEVDPELEVTEITQRVLQEHGPALLFERPKGSSTPLVMNLFGTMERVHAALGRDPAEIGSELVSVMHQLNPPSLKGIWQSRRVLKRGLFMHPSKTTSAPCQEVTESPDLTRLPSLKCWPGDAGRFITFGMVLTEHPGTGRRNLGLYRLQVFGKDQTGMHWQSMKGGRGHYWEAEQKKRDLDVAVVIGADPMLMLSAILPLPEDFDEIAFAGFLRGKGVPMVRAKTLDMMVPANAEFVLEGIVPAGERRMEGPFGDHFGHYSDAAEFPVFHVQKVTHRRNPVYAGTVVGKPPQEDKFLGIAAGQMIGPLIKVINPNVVDMCAYPGAGFHNLLVVALKERHPKEVLKTAMSLLGTGQLSLTKVMVLVGPDRSPADFRAVLRDVGYRFTPEDHMWLLPFAPLDTLDFTSFKMHVGSKLVIDATGDILAKPEPPQATDPRQFEQRIESWKLLDGGFLVIVVRQNAREVLQNLVKAPLGMRFVVAVSPDVHLDNDENLQWGIFTRFDPALDMIFGEQVFARARPLYRGTVGIDATWKEGYPAPLAMAESIVKLVDRRWAEYWK